MHIITRKRLNEFAGKHPAATSGLAHWYQALKKNNPANFAELRRIFHMPTRWPA
jgi:mRNA interferase HigB